MTPAISQPALFQWLLLSPGSSCPHRAHMSLDRGPPCNLQSSLHLSVPVCLSVSCAASLSCTCHCDTGYPEAFTPPRFQPGLPGPVWIPLLALRSGHPEALCVALADPLHLFFFFQTTVLCSCCPVSETLWFNSSSGFLLVQCQGA